MKTVFTIIKKEFSRFFKDTRLWFTAILLPGLLIFAMYTAIGGIINKVTEDEAAVKPVAVIEYLPASQRDTFAALFELKEESAEAAVEAVKSGKLDVFISFPQDFDEAVDKYSPSLGTPAPNVRIYYNSAQTKSMAAFRFGNAF